jgi:hypothetical protein
MPLPQRSLWPLLLVGLMGLGGCGPLPVPTDTGALSVALKRCRQELPPGRERCHLVWAELRRRRMVAVNAAAELYRSHWQDVQHFSDLAFCPLAAADVALVESLEGELADASGHILPAAARLGCGQGDCGERLTTGPPIAQAVEPITLNKRLPLVPHGTLLLRCGQGEELARMRDALDQSSADVYWMQVAAENKVHSSTTADPRHRPELGFSLLYDSVPQAGASAYLTFLDKYVASRPGADPDNNSFLNTLEFVSRQLPARCADLEQLDLRTEVARASRTRILIHNACPSAIGAIAAVLRDQDPYRRIVGCAYLSKMPKSIITPELQREAARLARADEYAVTEAGRGASGRSVLPNNLDPLTALPALPVLLIVQALFGGGGSGPTTSYPVRAACGLVKEGRTEP